MHKLVEVTQSKDSPSPSGQDQKVAINISKIKIVLDSQPHEPGNTTIYFTDETWIAVTETRKEVIEIVNSAS